MKPVSKYDFQFVIPQRAIQMTAICAISMALAACGGSGGGTEDGGSDTQDLFTDTDDTTDTDGDGLTDVDETTLYFTDPLLQDSDGDGVFDNEELDFNTDPNDASDADADFDGDGVGNYTELLAGTDPQDATSVIATTGDGTDTTDPVASNCVDTNSSTPDWTDNCQLQRFGEFADSLYTEGVQRILWCQGFGGGTTFDAYTDGEFGPGTQRSVQDFQTANGLTADGIIGPQTWASLRGKLFTDPDVVIGNVTYAPHVIERCEIDGTQFYQEIVFGELGGWKMAATPGSTTLINFSTDLPF